MLRQVYLAAVETQDARLAGTHLSEAVLAEAFSFPIAVAPSADGRLLASGGLDGTVRLWRVPGRRVLAVLEGHTGGVRGLPRNEGGELLVSGSQDRTVRLWRLAGLEATQPSSSRLLATLQRHTSGVCSVALSADGRLLASGSEDWTVRSWEASTGADLRSLRSDRRYERVDITGLSGVTAARRAALLALGAAERPGSQLSAAVEEC